MLLEVWCSWFGSAWEDLLTIVADASVTTFFGSGEMLPDTRPWHNDFHHLLCLRRDTRICINSNGLPSVLSSLALFSFNLNVNVHSFFNSVWDFGGWGNHLQENEKKITISDIKRNNTVISFYPKTQLIAQEQTSTCTKLVCKTYIFVKQNSSLLNVETYISVKQN